MMNCADLMYALCVSKHLIQTKSYLSLRQYLLICNNTEVTVDIFFFTASANMLFENKLCTTPFSNSIPPNDLCRLLSFCYKCTYVFQNAGQNTRSPVVSNKGIKLRKTVNFVVIPGVFSLKEASLIKK